MIKITLILTILACLGYSQNSDFDKGELEKLRASFIEPGDEKKINSILTGTYKSSGPTIIEMFDIRDSRADAKDKKKKTVKKKRKHKLEKHSSNDDDHLYCPVCNRDMTMDGLGPDDACLDDGVIPNEYL